MFKLLWTLSETCWALTAETTGENPRTPGNIWIHTMANISVCLWAGLAGGTRHWSVYSEWLFLGWRESTFPPSCLSATGWYGGRSTPEGGQDSDSALESSQPQRGWHGGRVIIHTLLYKWIPTDFCWGGDILQSCYWDSFSRFTFCHFGELEGNVSYWHPNGGTIFTRCISTACSLW